MKVGKHIYLHENTVPLKRFANADETIRVLCMNDFPIFVVDNGVYIGEAVEKFVKEQGIKGPHRDDTYHFKGKIIE